MKCDKLQRHSIRGVMYNGEEICGGFAYYDADEVDAAIDELKAAHHKERHEYIEMVAQLRQKLEDAQASAYADSVDAGMRERRLKRALWLARAQAADGFATISRWTDYEDLHPDTKVGYRKWYKNFMHAKALCRAKAEEYK